jgi:hypothetical protein
MTISVLRSGWWLIAEGIGAWRFRFTIINTRLSRAIR